MHEKFVYVYCCFNLRPNWFPVIWKAAFDLQKFPHSWSWQSTSCCKWLLVKESFRNSAGKTVWTSRLFSLLLVSGRELLIVWLMAGRVIKIMYAWWQDIEIHTIFQSRLLLEGYWRHVGDDDVGQPRLSYTRTAATNLRGSTLRQTIEKAVCLLVVFVSGFYFWVKS